MQKVDTFKQVSKDEKFLIILGNVDKQIANEDDSCKSIDYRGYLIKKDAETDSLKLADRWLTKAVQKNWQLLENY